MTSLSRKLSLAAFVVLTGGLATNVLVLQPPGRGAGSNATAQLGPGEGGGAWVEQLSLRTAGITPASETPNPAASEIPRVTDPGDTVELTRAIQRELKAKGYETGTVDGVAGLVTRAAIMAYEADAGLALTGEPRQALLQHIVLGSSQGPVPRADEGVPPGPYAETIIKSVQKALTQLGYAAGAIDGHMSPDTSAAIRKFEAQQRWPVRGRVSGELVAKLAGMTGHSAMLEMR